MPTSTTGNLNLNDKVIYILAFLSLFSIQKPLISRCATQSLIQRPEPQSFISYKESKTFLYFHVDSEQNLIFSLQAQWRFTFYSYKLNSKYTLLLYIESVRECLSFLTQQSHWTVQGQYWQNRALWFRFAMSMKMFMIKNFAEVFQWILLCSPRGKQCFKILVCTV